MAMEGVVGEAWILVRPYTSTFAPTLQKDLAKQTAIVDEQLASRGGLIGPKTVAATEKQAATAGEKAAAAMNARLGSLGKKATHGLGGALVSGFALAEAGKEVVSAATTMETAEASVASQTGETIKQVNSLGQAFLDTAKQGDVMFKASDLTSSYAAVAGQLKLTEGRVLSNAEALQFMKASEDAAEASQSDLSSTTGALAATMQAFHIPLKDVNKEADTLFNISRSLNIPISRVSTAVDRMHSRLGIAAPSLADTGALMVAFGKAGVQGQRGLMVVNSALSTLLAVDTKRGKATKATALQVQQARLAEMSATDAVIVAQHKYGTRSEQYAMAVARQRIAQQKLTATQKMTAGTMTAAGKVATELGLHIYNAHGKFVGMDSIIAQLQPKLAKMSDQHRTLALQTLFGKSAAQLMSSVIMAGVPGWNRSVAAVTKHGTAARGAALQQHTLRGETKTLTSQLDAYAVEVGQKVIPVVTDVTRWFVKHQAAGVALAGVIGTVLTLAIARYVGKLVWGTAQTAIQIGKQIAIWTGLATKAEATAGQVAVATTETQAAAGTAGAEISAAGAAAGGELEAGATTASTELAAGGATAEAELAAGGATAEAELSAGGATAEAELSAGGATAAAEETAGGAAGGLGGAAAGGLGLAARTGVAAAGVAAFVGTTEVLKHTGAGHALLSGERAVYNFFGGSAGKADTKLSQNTKDIQAFAKSRGETLDQLLKDPAGLKILRGGNIGGAPTTAPTPRGWHAPMAMPTPQNEAELKRLIAEQGHRTKAVADHTNTTNALLKRQNALLAQMLAALSTNHYTPGVRARFEIPEMR